MLADIYESMGKIPEAIALLQSIHDSYPNPKVIEVRLAYLKKKSKKKAVKFDGPDNAKISQ